MQIAFRSFILCLALGFSMCRHEVALHYFSLLVCHCGDFESEFNTGRLCRRGRLVACGSS
jgi:hypothetical protein